VSVSRSTDAAAVTAPSLRARRLGLFTQHEAVVLMRTDCHVCRAEGLTARAQVVLSANGREAFATLYQVDADWLGHDEAGLSEALWSHLGASDGAEVVVRHAPALESLSSIRRRIYGQRLSAGAFNDIVGDVVAGRYTDIHLAAFLTASSALPLDHDETVALTRAMVGAGERLTWPGPVIVDKHSVGGLPGNRTTPIVVAIGAAFGLTMPKTSSRAITSPAGTADTMETLAPVDLDLPAIRKVVEREGGCVVWGGAVKLSPADDVFIRVERVLDVDTEGQLVASVLSKKIAAGSTHVVLDIPIGPTAKVRSEAAGLRLAETLARVGDAFGLATRCLISDGSQPVGRGIGPALEALDVVEVLQNSAEAPRDLRDHACVLAGAALEFGGVAKPGEGAALAGQALDDGRAWAKFLAICEAQGGLRTPPVAKQTRPLVTTRSGRVVHINNRKVARLAKLAGAPEAKAAGVRMGVRLGDEVAQGQTLLEVHADSAGELAYALDYAAHNPDLVEIEP
jgi:thymidine phosphorylase